jgi:DNA-binding MarR family transcriptional regulator
MDTRALAEELFASICTHQENPVQEAHNSSKGEMQILAYLTREQEVATPTALSCHFHLSTARVANVLNSLEKKGLVQRQRDQRDHRKVYVCATPLGRETAIRGREKAICDLMGLLHALGEEDAAHLVRLTKRVDEIARRAHSCPPTEEA